MSVAIQSFSPPTAETSRIPEWPRWVWSLIGGLIGLFDYGVLLAFDANLSVAGHDLTLAMGVLFFIPYCLLGWAVGGLAAARSRSERDRKTIVRQLTELERAQRALVQEEKLAGIGRLAAGVAHEVRNPLGVIRASASMAQESFEANTDPHRALGFICEETDRLDRLIASLLTFAKPQPIECVETDLGKIFDRVVELATREAKAAAISIGVDVEPGLPPLYADPDRLSQSLYGLTLNAIQSITESGESAGRIQLSARAEDDLLRIEVVDSGPGIPVLLQDQIFEPFVTSKDTGTGLGLPMALRMIEAQGGVLRLDTPDVSDFPSVGGRPHDPEPPSANSDLDGARFIIEFAAGGGAGESEQ